MDLFSHRMRWLEVQYSKVPFFKIRRLPEPKFRSLARYFEMASDDPEYYLNYPWIEYGVCYQEDFRRVTDWLLISHDPREEIMNEYYNLADKDDGYIYFQLFDEDQLKIREKPYLLL